MVKIAIYVFDNYRLPAFLQPYVFGFIIGRWPHKVKESEDDQPFKEIS